MAIWAVVGPDNDPECASGCPSGPEALAAAAVSDNPVWARVAAAPVSAPVSAPVEVLSLLAMVYSFLIGRRTSQNSSPTNRAEKALHCLATVESRPITRAALHFFGRPRGGRGSGYLRRLLRSEAAHDSLAMTAEAVRFRERFPEAFPMLQARVDFRFFATRPF